MKIILASASPRRRELMKYIAGEFTAVSADCDETLPRGISPMNAAQYLAELKAKTIAQQYPEDIVIGCDTTVICGSEILGKPKDRQDCIDCISKLSGKTHQVVTGCCITFGGKISAFSDVTDVKFRKLSADKIEQYASTDEPYDKAGGYGIQGGGSEFISDISGDFFNVVGLPVTRLYREMKKYIQNL